MKTLPLLFTLAVAVAAASPGRIIAPREAVQKPPEVPIPNALTTTGCFDAEGSWEKISGYPQDEVSSGFCEQKVCAKLNVTVMAIKGAACYCGNQYPPKGRQVDDDKCDYPCPGYGLETCGGIKSPPYWSVFNLGVEVDVPYLSDTNAPSSSDGGDGDAVPAETSAAASASSAPEKSANVGGIAAGVVVGVIAIAGAAGGIFFFIKRKRNKEIEEEHRRNAAVNAFMGHKPGSSGAVSITDARLDPVMAQRRLSDGSIADNQDYSRRILRVTNA